MAQSLESAGSAQPAHDFAEVNGVGLHYAYAGDGPLIVFLHGFPQCWYQFCYQLGEFSHDHLAVAPDLRGYDLSSLVVLDTPHPALFDRALHEDPEQQHASAYMLVARRADASDTFSAEDFRVLREALDEPFINAADLERYVESWRPPGAMAAALRWFHAEGQGPPSPDGTPASANIVRHIQPLTVTVPTLVMYPTADRWIRPASHAGLERYVPDLTFVAVDGATHWLPEERPELVNQAIREHLARVATAGSVGAAPARP
jgi:pimeloyl-ACP methyl ester carboxylesterase